MSDAEACPSKSADLPRPPDQSVDGQMYRFLSHEDHVRKDGSPTKLARWATHCATCGGPFEFMISGSASPRKRRRCDEHRKPGLPVRREKQQARWYRIRLAKEAKIAAARR